MTRAFRGVYHRLRTLGVYAARRMPGARAVARAVIADELGSMRTRAAHGATPALDIHPGRFFAQDKGRQLPVVVVVATGMDVGDAERLAAAVERAQFLTGSFRPLFVVDSAEFAPFRTRGYAVERVMPVAAYAEVSPHDSYAEYLYGRVSSVARGYRAASVVPMPAQLIEDDLMLRLIGVNGF